MPCREDLLRRREALRNVAGLDETQLRELRELDLLLGEGAVPSELRGTHLFGWVGEDEMGSGEVGLKQMLAPCGMTPLVSVREEKIDRPEFQQGLQAQSNMYGKTIYLVEYMPVRVRRVLVPNIKEDSTT